ncbi:hypothetical protein Tco_0336792 [Tanacetum coccineum]
MVEEPVKTMKKKDLIRLNEETAKRLQAEFDKEERLAREKDEANVALTKEQDDIQAKIEADHELAQRLQAEEQEELYVKEKKMFDRAFKRVNTFVDFRTDLVEVVQREQEKSWNKRVLRSRRWMGIKGITAELQSL